MPTTRQNVYEMLTKENDYAQGWNRSPEGEDPGNDQNWGYMDWIIFAEKYLSEAKLAWAEYTPDERAVRIRIMKAASLLVTALENLGKDSDLQDIAGISSTKYPVLKGGLQTYKNLTQPRSSMFR